MIRPLIAVLLLGMTAIFGWVIWLGQPDFPLDDAYIVQHAVNGIWYGSEIRFAEALPIHGATSPIHVLLILLLSALVPTAWAQLLVAGAAFLLYLTGVSCLAHRYGLSGVLRLTVAGLASIAGLGIYQFANGLETGLAMGLVIWALIIFHDPLPVRNWHAALLGLLPFVRPELGALSLLILLRALWFIRQAGTSASLPVSLALWSGLGAAVPIIFLLVNGGSIIPNTTSAKVYFFAEGCHPFIDKLRFSSLAMLLFLQGLGLASAGVLGLLNRRLRFVALSFTAIFLLAYILRFPGALFHNGFRYAYLLVPLVMAGWIALLALESRGVRLISRTGLVAATLWSVTQLPDTFARLRGEIEITRIERAGISAWIEQNVPADTPILVHDAGYISLHGRQPLIDLVGLKTPSSVPAHVHFTWGACARHPGAIDQIARHSGARYFVVLDEWDRIFMLTASLKAAGWAVERADVGRARSSYKIYRIIPPREAQF